MSSPVPDRAEYLRMLPPLRQQLRAAELRAQEAAAEAESLRKVIQGLQELAGERPNGRQASLLEPLTMGEIDELLAPRGQEAVKQVLATEDRVWSARELLEVIQAKGWIEPDAKTPLASVRVAAQRLVKAGGAVKVGSGYQRSRTPGEVSAA